MNDLIDDGESTLVTGWGETKNPVESRFALRGVIVKTINQNVCKQVYKSSLTNIMVCAGDMQAGGVDACQLSI